MVSAEELCCKLGDKFQVFLRLVSDGQSPQGRDLAHRLHTSLDLKTPT